ncbi:MAG: hypothetical protein JXR59_04545 [Desulfuromonadaceae bacterium]|nr:hypothetical protein [Desulfuromonadaceae bacterium]
MPSDWDKTGHGSGQRLLTAAILLSFCLSGCSLFPERTLPIPPDVVIVNHHIASNLADMEEFCRRLYLKNPKYEPDEQSRQIKLQQLFHPAQDTYPTDLPSHKLLEDAFSAHPSDTDRIYLLARGLRQSLTEGYGGLDGRYTTLSGMQLSAERLQRLYLNLQQLNWRLKVYHDQNNELLFQTNAIGEDGYFNMGYEVLMTRILTRISDDIILREEQPPHFIFNMSALFLPLLL